ncbi:MAG: aminotransferase class I/II-fold pyridoxal phosphate-dependent enzyme [Nitrososphaerota archaeon]|nr:aminotransferase class I/II-fold pyridoxal phosphate-dependent enzyme [Candidatus Bathyarchaeota archaeon]MDW8022819.1 aminotransferase class I/II-fold pyridoxal phosphate-dependent enzyme [Nitrososphaerota archaeon]
MVKLDPQAEELNHIIKTRSETVYNLLSKRGKAIYFPRKGILAQGMAAKDKEINATVGIAHEDDGKPMILPSMAKHIALNSGDVFPYAPSEGLKPLREKWKELIKMKNPSIGTNEISLPVVTCGATHGLSMVGYLFVDEGDEIIISDLYWENYDLVFSNAYDAKLRTFNLFKNGRFDIDSFSQTINADPVGKKIVLLNFPHNPSGYSPTKNEAKIIVNTLHGAAEDGNKLAVILDDSYFGLVFEENTLAESLFAQLSNLHENLLAIKVDGITKEEYAWGLRVGFITYGIKKGDKELYKALEDKTAGAVRGSISNASHLSQSLFLSALKSETYQKEKERNKEKIKERYLKVKEILKEHREYAEHFETLPFNSGYFMCIKLKNVDANRVWEALLNKYSTGVICYGEKNMLRIAFASTPTDKLEKLFNNIYLACKDCAQR